MSLEVVARDNPHCRQLLARSNRHYAAGGVPVTPLEATAWSLGPEAPQRPFENRDDSERTPLHFGQVKLLQSMLAFLLWHTEASRGVRYALIYAGAAPGHSAAFVAGLFPEIEYHLFDPAEFCAELSSPPANVHLYNGYFTDGTAELAAERFAGCRVLFVSDIRSGKDQGSVATDMAAQDRWARMIGAEASMLKFRLPWGAGSTPYLDGVVVLQAFAPLTSTECRLISTHAQVAGPPRAYDNGAHERQMAYHNMIGRVLFHSHGVRHPGLDHCYDCAVLVLTASEHLRRTTGGHEAEAVAEWIARALSALKTGRGLDTPHAVSSTRRRGKGRK